jgi:glutamate--cysteine ligase catalytic subunit
LVKDNTGVDDRMAEHIARIFWRDPVPAYEGEFLDDQIDDNDLTCHFENLQSTNWNSLRFKPPPSQNSSIGWRVEFRTMDIQLTDFENTCLIVALGLIVNVINHFDVNFIMPITKVDENMNLAHKRDGILNQKFWFNVNSIKQANFDIYNTSQATLE